MNTYEILDLVTWFTWVIFAIILKKMYNHPGMKQKEKKMSQLYKEKIFNDIENIPVDLLPKLYRIVHLLKKELVYPKSKSGNRASLRGIWKNSEIDESLFDEARRSLFKYESA